MARFAGEPVWFWAFVAGITLGSALGARLALKRVEEFFGPEEMEPLKRAERARFANDFAKPS